MDNGNAVRYIGRGRLDFHRYSSGRTDSWTQFFKNLPVALIAFVVIFSDIFTKEYKSGTLLLVLTKGLSRYKVVLAKTALLLSLWTVGYGIYFAITYGYNAYFWDNGIANNLFFSVAIWWLFGAWVICLIVLFSSLLQNNTGVALCIGGTVLLAYLLSIIPKVKAYSPIALMNTNSLLMGEAEIDAYIKAIAIAVSLCIVCVAVSIPVINKRQLKYGCKSYESRLDILPYYGYMNKLIRAILKDSL